VVQVGDIVRLVRVFLGARIPTVVFFHDIYSMPPADELPQDDLLRFAACSASIAERVRHLYGAEPFLVPVLVQPRLYLTETLRRVVTFVNPRQPKGLDIAIGLATERPDIPFEFVESTFLGSKAMRSLAARLRALKNVRFIHRTDDMRKIYRHSRLVLMPSLCVEAWGRVVSEAQVSGIPALASSSGGLPEAVGPGGLIVDREASLTDWVAALGRLWDDASEYQYYAEAAMRHASRPEMQPDAVIARMLELIIRTSASRG
jgi:glycosyltransferase involved in cell wall biosynthesis